jgi:hypothetical protein
VGDFQIHRAPEASPRPSTDYSIADIERTKQIIARYSNRALPILINDEDQVLSGWLFVEAARALGQKTIRVIVQSGLSSTEALLLGTAVTKIQNNSRLDLLGK